MDILRLTPSREEKIGEVAQNRKQINENGDSLAHEFRPLLETMEKLEESRILHICGAETEDDLCDDGVSIPLNNISKRGGVLEQLEEHLLALEILVGDIRLRGSGGETCGNEAVGEFPGVVIFLHTSVHA